MKNAPGLRREKEKEGKDCAVNPKQDLFLIDYCLCNQRQSQTRQQLNSGPGDASGKGH